jgi:hypothetical protein
MSAICVANLEACVCVGMTSLQPDFLIMRAPAAGAPHHKGTLYAALALDIPCCCLFVSTKVDLVALRQLARTLTTVRTLLILRPDGRGGAGVGQRCKY